jgi:hypothetical protein
MTKYNLGNSIENIKVTENILSIQEHTNLLEYAKSIESWNIQPWGVKFFQSQNMPNEIVDSLEKVFRIAYNECISFYNVKLHTFKREEVHLIKFEKNYKMNEHADTTGDIAAIYYINDDYSGGEINFMDHKVAIKPKANSLITFPSNEDYWHEVLENTENERYSSTLWFKFEGTSLLRLPRGLIR